MGEFVAMAVGIVEGMYLMTPVDVLCTHVLYKRALAL